MTGRVLVLGGYGGFGARLSRRLAGDGWAVLVTGRNLAKAEAFARTLPGARGLRADRNAPLDALLAELQPDLLIDAAGPFQDSGYAVVESCIAQGVPYLDLADAREFVCGIGSLDAKARAAGVVVISGASSVPALSGAVVRRLARGMERIDHIEIALSASTRSSVGASVLKAALSYAGQPVQLWRAGEWRSAIGWRMLRCERFELAGMRPMLRLVALAEVPDLELMPGHFPGQPATLFRAGPEFSLQLIALWLLSWLVSWRWLGSLLPLARVLAPLQRLTARLGSDRSAMAIELRGWMEGSGVTRRWTLIAERGEGPEIPTLAAQLLAGKLASGGLAPGARTAIDALELADFDTKFAEIAVGHEITEKPCVPLYRQAMGADFDRLAPPLQAMHDVIGAARATGTAQVERGRSLLARLIGTVMGFPPGGDYPVEVRFAAHGGKERWTRQFGKHSFSSEMSRKGALLTERFGPMRFHFKLVPTPEGGLIMDLRSWSCLRIPMPRLLAPRIAASERAEGEAFCFDVAVALPLIGLVVRYAGRLLRD
jgi:hypothetical protein